MSDFNKMIDEAYAKLWAERPAECTNMFERNKGNGKHFSVLLNDYVDIEEFNSAMMNVATWAAEEQGDLATVKMFAIKYLKSTQSVYTISFNMPEFAELCGAAAEAVEAAADFAELKNIARKMHLYGVRLWYWIDGLMPWAKISTFFNEVKGLY